VEDLRRRRVRGKELVFLPFFLLLTMVWSAWALESYVHPEYLIETDELANIMHDPAVVIIDAEDRRLYQRAHIPGAINIPRLSLADLNTRREKGFPISQEKAEEVFGSAGIDRDTQVIVYDSGEGPNASGVWFVLRFFGHEKVRLLNGGFRKWLEERRPVTQEVPRVEKRDFQAIPHPEMVITSDWLLKNLKKEDLLLLDARSFQEYVGEELKGGVARGGHIPGAIHLEWVKVADRKGSKTFKAPSLLEKVFSQRGITRDKEIITYCQTGIGRSTALFFALELLGYKKIRLYTGSWEDWGNDPALPIER